VRRHKKKRTVSGDWETALGERKEEIIAVKKSTGEEWGDRKTTAGAHLPGQRRYRC